MKLLVTAYLLNIIDYLFTLYWVNLYGIDIEGNPLGRWLYENNLAGVMKIGVLGVLFIVLALLSKKTSLGCVPLILFLVYGLIVAYHIALLFII